MEERENGGERMEEREMPEEREKNPIEINHTKREKRNCESHWNRWSDHTGSV